MSHAPEQLVKGSREEHRTNRFFRNYGLTLALFGIFLILGGIQTAVGHADLNDDLREHGQPTLSYLQYFQTGICWESLSENWESEFLEMGAFVWFTAFLFQKGSSQSHDPDDPDDDQMPLSDDSPWPVRRGGLVRVLYERSLSLVFLILFLVAFGIHAVSGASEYNRQQLLHGQPRVSVIQFLGTSRLWFQSLQNWQSEFLGIGCMVLLSIWLRHKGSAESKPVNAPHHANA